MAKSRQFGRGWIKINNWFVFYLSRSIRVTKRVKGFLEITVCRTDTSDHQGITVSSERVCKKKKKTLESLFPPKPLSLIGSPRKRKKSEREQECNTEAQPVVFAIRFIHRNFCIAIALIGYMYLRYIYNWRVFKHFMCFNNRKRGRSAWPERKSHLPGQTDGGRTPGIVFCWNSPCRHMRMRGNSEWSFHLEKSI